MIITIDWLSGTWKGTTAKWVAKTLWYTYLDTWAMYRAAIRYAKQNDLLDASDQDRSAIIDDIVLEFRQVNLDQHIFLNWRDIEKEIRDPQLLFHLKPIVNCQPLREKMIKLQQSFWKTWNIVCDGRDAGTHIFPNASLKVFLICDIDERVRRRIAQLKDASIDADELKKQMHFRDQNDYLWANAINKKAKDAKELDTTRLSIDQQIKTVVDRANNLDL